MPELPKKRRKASGTADESVKLSLSKGHIPRKRSAAKKT